MKLLRISGDEADGSRSSDVTVDLESRAFAVGVPALLVSAPIPAHTVTFVQFPEAVGDTAPHPTPRRQLGVVLSGAAETRTTDGNVRQLTPGCVVLVEDTDGRGHITRVIERPFEIMFVALDAVGDSPADAE